MLSTAPSFADMGSVDSAGSFDSESWAAATLNSSKPGVLSVSDPWGVSLSRPELKGLRDSPCSRGWISGLGGAGDGGSRHPPSLRPPPLSAGGVQGHNGFLSLLRRVQLLLAVHRGPVPLHPAGGDLLPREEILLLVHHGWLG